jgi:hypothetical protein
MTTKAIPLLLLAATLLLSVELAAQVPATRAQAGSVIFLAPEDNVVNFMNAQALACQIADTAKSADLNLLDLMLQRMIQQEEEHVRKVSADSAPGLAAKRTFDLAVAGLRPLETELGRLQVRRKDIKELLEPDEARIAAAQGDESPGSTRLEAEIQRLQVSVAADSAAHAKDPNKDRWFFDTRDQSLKNRLMRNRDSLAVLTREREQNLQTVKVIRENPVYAGRVADKAKLDVEIAELAAKIKRLEERRDTAKLTLADINLASIDSLATLHDRNGFVHQYLSQARDCIQKRRTQLAGAPAAQPGGLETVYIVGTWTATCSGDLPPGAARTDGGRMDFIFSEPTNNSTEVPVRVGFITSGKVIGIDYGAAGRVLNDGTIVDGRGGAPGLSHSVVWDGRLAPDMARSNPARPVPDKWMGSGNVTVTDIYRQGAGTCTGTWKAATP